MKIGIVSDIHATPQALRRALEDMPSVDCVLCAGDAISEFQFCGETIALLQQAGAQCIQGNHEWVFFNHSNPRYLDKCLETFGQDTLNFLARAPESLETEVDGANILMVHTSPWQPFDGYIPPGSPQLARFADLPCDYVILGHTHVPMVQTVGQVTVINPGSCAQPRDQDRRGAYAVLDVEQRQVDIYRFSLT
jgi:putative phosphoesterase